jgi:hypothetical protein
MSTQGIIAEHVYAELTSLESVAPRRTRRSSAPRSPRCG